MAAPGLIQAFPSTVLLFPSMPLSYTAPLVIFVVLLLLVYVALRVQKTPWLTYTHLPNFCTFFYSTFLKPHSQDEGSGQQAALESFYKVQVARTEDSHLPEVPRLKLLCLGQCL